MIGPAKGSIAHTFGISDQAPPMARRQIESRSIGLSLDEEGVQMLQAITYGSGNRDVPPPKLPSIADSIGNLKVFCLWANEVGDIWDQLTPELHKKACDVSEQTFGEPLLPELQRLGAIPEE